MGFGPGLQTNVIYTDNQPDVYGALYGQYKRQHVWYTHTGSGVAQR